MSSTTAQRLNAESAAQIDRALLARHFAAYGLDAGALRQSHPNLLADAVVHVDAEAQQTMAELIAAIEQVAALPAYREAIAARMPESARLDLNLNADCAGVFMGYDFHLTAAGPRLIEINTNAGGAFLNAVLAAARPGLDDRAAELEKTFAEFVAMFGAEWQRATPPRIAIVDEAPQTQFLAPEFALARTVFARVGWPTVIADPGELVWQHGRLHYTTGATGAIDLIYNRLTDFALAAPRHAHLRAAYAAGAVCLTPNPRAYALLADKRNLILLSDPEWLTAARVPQALQERLLAGIPKTEAVKPENAERLWRQRKQLFFKPADGFGSRAAYRGHKLSRGKFAEILGGNMIAQTITPPSTRRLVTREGQPELKLDVRQYAYRGHIQLTAARLYQGQITNMRTPGGGFAAVAVV
ncbi:MAG: hypothetical protein LBB51_04225 [Zoogloeaceae bacterium]|jgi:hypothetical protein|nr:hypothetical protein [Zoogloeaceae bacterium]